MGDYADTYDVFLSYHTRDHAAVERIADALRARGITPFLDRWSLRPGLAWPQELEQALARSAAVAVFIGRDGMGAWQHREQFLALDRQGRDHSFPVIPVLLPGSEPPLGFLRLNTWVDLRQRADDPQGLAILEAAIQRRPPGAEAAATIRRTASTLCPYRGLQFFREEDAALFFGREKATADLISAVHAQALVAVIGASGSGKSSVVRAGLVPHLRADLREHGWDIATIKPGEEPLHALMEVLSPPAEDLSRAQRLAHLEADVRALRDQDLTLRRFVADAFRQSSGSDRFLLVVDQFEELYAAPVRPDDRERFLKLLLEATDDGPLRVVLTLRADFFDRVLRDRALGERISEAPVLLLPMSRDELADAIARPAQAVGLEFEVGLVERILDDVGAGSDNLPLLEFLLKELWEQRRGPLLHFDAYQAIGGVTGAITARAEAVYEKFSPAQQQTAHRVLLQMVRLGDGTTPPTRRQAFIAASDTEAWDVIERLADARTRLVVTGKAGKDDKQPVATVTHEALIRNWDRLGHWIQSEQAFLRRRERVEAAAALWEEDDQSESRLLAPGRALAEAEELLTLRRLDLSPLVVAFIEASSLAARARLEAERQVERKRLQRTRLATVAMAVLATVAVVGGIIAYDRANVAKEQQQQAFEQRQQALARLLATQANTLIERAGDDNTSLQRAAALAVESWRRMNNADAYAAAAKLLSWVPITEFEVPRSIESKQKEEPEFVQFMGIGLSPDGKYIAVLMEPSFILLFDASGREIARLPMSADGWPSFDFSPDSRTLVIFRDSELTLIDTATGRMTARIESPHPMNNYEFSSDGQTLAIAKKNFITVVNLSSGQERLLVSLNHEVRDLKFSRDGSLLAAMASSGPHRLLDVETGHQRAIVHPDHRYLKAGFFAGDRYLAIVEGVIESSVPRIVKIIDMQSGTELPRFVVGPEKAGIELPSRSGSVLAVVEDKTRTYFKMPEGREMSQVSDQSKLHGAGWLDDGRKEVLYNEDGAIMVFDTGTGETKTLSKPFCNPKSINANDEIITIVCKNSQVRTLETKTGAELATFSPGEGSLSPDGRYYIATEEGKPGSRRLRLIDARSGQLLRVTAENGGPPPFLNARRSQFKIIGMIRVDTSDNGSQLAVADTFLYKLRLLDLSGAHRPTLLEIGEAKSWVISSDERRLTVGRGDPFVRLIDPGTGQLIGAFPTDGEARPIHITDDGRVFVSTPGRFESVDVASGMLLGSIALGHGSSVLGSTSDDGYVLLWAGEEAVLIDTKEMRKVMRFPYGGAFSVAGSLNPNDKAHDGSSARVNDFSFSPDGRSLAMAIPHQNAIRIVDVATGNERLLKTFGGKPNHIAFSPDSMTLVVDVYDNTVRLIDVATGVERRRLMHQRDAWTVATAIPQFSADGRTIAIVDWHGEDERVFAWLFDPESGQERAQIRPETDRRAPDEIPGNLGSTMTRFSPDGRFFAVGATGGDPVRLFDAHTGKELARIPLGEGLKGVAFSPDDHFLAALGLNGEVALMATDTLQVRGNLRHAAAVTHRTFSPDSRYLATASLDGTVRLMETASGREIARFDHGSPVQEVDFVANGRTILTTAKDGRMRLFPVDPQWPIDQLCARLGQNLSRSEWRALFGSEPWRPTCKDWRTPDETASMADAAIQQQQ